MQKKILFLLVVMMVVTTNVFAQITTSSMAGQVTEGNAQGEKIIGATVQAVHEPSGTRYTAVTNMDGRFAIQGMRTGGPYTVTISYIGFTTKIIKDVTLQLGETYDLPVVITEDANQLEEVVVVGSASKFAGEKTGAATNINNTQITNLPTVNRSITEVTRLSPYGGNGMTFGGSDGRTANFTVDGANFNNDFGLSDGLPGGGNPISIDAIEEMQVVISPFDVRQTNFIGGGVNAITKSGTNTFKGSVYVYHQNENLRGDAVNRTQISSARDKDQETTYGFTVGGPIIKNKLFFFANGEMVKTPTIANRWRGSEDGVSDETSYISRTKLSDLQTVKDYVMNKYGYDTGSYTSFPADESNYKLLARLDWNITDNHHLALRYNYTKNRYWSSPNGTSMDGGTRAAHYRMSLYSMSFANSMYAMDNLVHSFSIDLNSRLSDNLTNQFLATYTKKDDIRASNSDEFPFIDILDGDGDNYIALGYELFTWNNAVHNTTWNIKDDLTYSIGNHKIMGGLSFEHQMADNAYMRNGAGYYRYKTLDDFLTGAAPEVVCLTYGYGGEDEPTARVQFNRAGIYAQDDWSINNRFKLSYGARFDGLFFNNNDLTTNNAILALNYYDADGNVRHIDTGKWPGSTLTVSPRVGFTWDVFGDKSLKLRGGSGFFSGRLPLVFFTNMPTNSGMVQYQAQLNSKSVDMSQFAGGLVTDANGKATIAALREKLISMGYPENITPDEGTVPSSISAVDSKFKMPQVWKTSLAVDYQIPISFPMSVTVEGIYNKMINDVCVSDWSMLPTEGFARWNGADDRAIYPTTFRNSTKAFVLENTSKGYGWQASVTLNAQPFEWMNFMASYTHTVKKEITDMPGSAAESAFTYIPTVFGPNNIKLHNGANVTPDRFVASLNMSDKSGNHYNLIYETWRGGYNYSYMMSNDMNGDGYNYDAIYIPTDAEVANNEFRFTSTDDRDRFMAYVHGDSYLKNHQGEYAEAYSVYNPWVHRIDFSYKHDFKFKTGNAGHKIQLSFDIKNLLNLFNSSWGVMKTMNTSLNSGRILKYEKTDAEGYPVFSTPAGVTSDVKTWVPNYVIGQCWYASIGIKYIFN